VKKLVPLILATAALTGAVDEAGAQTATVIVAKDWPPTQHQGDAALASLKAYLAAPDQPSQWAGKTRETVLEKRERAAVLARMGSYSIRIMGKVSQAQPALAADVAGKKIVQLNGFCRAENSDWKSPGFLVMDGGACYFNADYDSQTDAIVHFGINGGG
jgi:hypothetical protein